MVINSRWINSSKAAFIPKEVLSPPLFCKLNNMEDIVIFGFDSELPPHPYIDGSIVRLILDRNVSTGDIITFRGYTLYLYAASSSIITKEVYEKLMEISKLIKNSPPHILSPIEEKDRWKIALPNLHP